MGARDAFLRTTQAPVLCSIGVASLTAGSQSRSTSESMTQRQKLHRLECEFSRTRLVTEAGIAEVTCRAWKEKPS